MLLKMIKKRIDDGGRQGEEKGVGRGRIYIYKYIINYREILTDTLVIRLSICTEMMLFSTATYLKGHFLQKPAGQISVGSSNHELE